MDKAAYLYNKLQSEPLFFLQDIIGIKPWSKQRQAIKATMDTSGAYHNKTAIKSCHGIGKTFISGNIALQFLYTYSPSIVVTTAPTFRQVEKGIWKEIRQSYELSKIPLGGKLQEGAPLLQIVKDQWYAFGLATNESDRFQGLHEENILVVVDEAAGVSEQIFTAIDGLLTSTNAKLLIIGNPTSSLGTFKKAFEEPGWNRISIGAYDTPNFKLLGIKESDIASGEWEEKQAKWIEKHGRLPLPKLVTPMWVADKYKRWRPESMLYRTRVLGQFDDAGSDGVIPLAWIEAAIERNKELPDTSEETCIGVDVAEFGRDCSNVFIKKGRKILKPYTYSKIPIMQLVGNIVIHYHNSQAQYVNVDTIGVGTGVEGRLDEIGIPTHRVNVSEAPGGIKEQETVKFINKRAQLYWALRELLDPDNPDAIGLPDDEELTEELVATRYKINSNGKIQIVAKDDIKAIIGRSPDKADALVMCTAPSHLLNRTVVMQSAGTW